MAQEAILIKEKGVVTLNKSFDFMCSQLRNGRYRLIIERYTEPRTLSQNALMWLWFTCIEQETGTDKQGRTRLLLQPISTKDNHYQRKRNGHSRKHIETEHTANDGLFE